MSEPHILHAYYSAKAAELFGTIIYLADPTRCGGPLYELGHYEPYPVDVTCVGADKAWMEEHYMWDDKVYLGRVTEWLASGRPGSWPMDEGFPPYGV